MRTSGRWSGLILLTFALVGLAPVAFSATTTVQVEVGDAFDGDIGAAGVDNVEAHFNAVEGTTLRVAARAADGATLVPTILATDGAGTPIGGGTSLEIEWLPVRNALYFFTTPSSGSYIVRIGGASGSGAFSASITGDLPDGVQLATVSGRVVNDLTSAGIAGATVTVGSFSFVTDATGAWSGQIPVGSYSVTVTAAEFLTGSGTADLQAGGTTTVDIGLAYAEPVLIDTAVTGDAVPGGSVTATVDVDLRDGSTLQSVSWTQEHGVPVASITGAGTDTATITLGAAGAYKDELIFVLSEPPIGPDQLPPNVPVPSEEFSGGLQSRFQAVGMSPFAIEEAAAVVLEVEIQTTGGTYHEEVEIHAALPWKPTAGIKNVPIGVPVLLHGKEQASYDWAMTVPPGSTATLADATTQSPDFMPDVPGTYQVQVTPEGEVTPLTLTLYAGNWRGVIVGQDVDDRPVADGACTTCHGTIAEDVFTPWAQTGHAEIFTNNLNTSTHYGPNCFPCHMVGFDGAANSGADDSSEYAAFMGAGLVNSPGDNWSTVLDDFPDVARLSNIQCENCHGPQEGVSGVESDAHAWQGPEGEPRVSLSSDVCATCHGEPLRHARFQQWQLSAHANYELAVDEGESGSCSRCHTANGFLAWLPVLLDDDPETDPTASVTVTWEPDEVHPQTCVTCHDPHAIGTTTGSSTNATVRISGDTPLLIAGFVATDVGRGAICMTCHNSRRGLRNDDTFDTIVGTSEAARAPHGSAQTDMLMGENAFLVEVGNRGNHSMITDTCAECHMVQTPPPDLLAYNSGGTNHTFFAGTDICADCHGDNFDAEDVQAGIQSFMDDVQEQVEEAMLELIAAQIDAGNTIDLSGAATITDVGEVQDLVFGETRGRQAITVTFTDDSTFGPYRITDVDVVDSMDSVLGILYDFADPGLIKAGWNWNLLHNDGSKGVHNPTFAYQILIASRDALAAIEPAAPALAPSRSLMRSTTAEERPRWFDRRDRTKARTSRRD